MSASLVACAWGACGALFAPYRPAHRYCSRRCRVAAGRQRRGLAPWRPRAGARIPCMGPGCRKTFAPRSHRHRYCSARCRSRAHRVAQQRTGHGPREVGRCVWWDRVAAALAGGPLDVATLALEVHDRDDAWARKATRAMMARLATLGQVERVRYGWYALPGREDGVGRATTADVRRWLRRRPRTIDDLIRLTQASERVVYALLAPLRASGDLRRATAPRWRWTCPTRSKSWYWIGAGLRSGTSRWTENLTEAQREARRAYARDWRRRHRTQEVA